jgi:hypothetical protein
MEHLSIRKLSEHVAILGALAPPPFAKAPIYLFSSRKLVLTSDPLPPILVEQFLNTLSPVVDEFHEFASACHGASS